MIALKLVCGLVLLVVGAEALVRGASRIAAALGITPLVIGLTVVAFGTSTPELAVSVLAGLNGQGGLAIGNVVGSNIFNVLFILGVSSLIVPLVVAQQLIRLDVPLMIGVSLLTWFFARDGTIGPFEGLVFLVTGIGYTVFVLRASRKEKRDVPDEATAGRAWLSVLYVVAGLALLLMGSRWLVDGAVAIARNLGVSDLVVGLTIVAAGTSLPEVATSVMASVRGERDIAVGNVVGSNIFNIVFILGLAALTSGGIPVEASAIRFDIPVMVAVAVACLPVFFTATRLDRWEGFVFLGYYGAYTAYIVLAAMRHSSLATFSTAMLWFVVPLTVLTLGIVLARELRLRR